MLSVVARIVSVEVLFIVEEILSYSQAVGEALIVDDFSCTEKLYNVAYIGVVR